MQYYKENPCRTGTHSIPPLITNVSLRHLRRSWCGHQWHLSNNVRNHHRHHQARVVTQSSSSHRRSICPGISLACRCVGRLIEERNVLKSFCFWFEKILEDRRRSSILPSNNDDNDDYNSHDKNGYNLHDDDDDNYGRGVNWNDYDARLNLARRHPIRDGGEQVETDSLPLEDLVIASYA